MTSAQDFDDIIRLSVQLLKENPDVLEYYTKRFLHVIVDEYQDTNMAQYELISMLASGYKNLCVVGDDDQSIYGWRGADIKNIIEFEKEYQNCTVIKLEQNYRSTQRILDVANHVIKNSFFAAKVKEKKQIISRLLWSRKCRAGAQAIEILQSYTEPMRSRVQ